MALQAVVRGDGYSYTQAIDRFDEEQIENSKEQFDFFKATGMIISGEYNARRWLVTDEVRAVITINFTIDEVHFVREAAQKLGCTFSQYQQAMRVAITSRFGYSLRTLQDDANSLTRFANTLTVPECYTAAQLLIDLLELLPGQTTWRQKILEQLQDVPAPKKQSSRQRRTLAVYQSYFRFNDFLDRFWKEATLEEKDIYFPVFFWWKVTSILPLRPTECVLTPRNCIRKDDIGRYYLTIRRTKVKGTSQSVQYSIAKDYEKYEWRIPEPIAIEILRYIESTKDLYESDIDVLFCKSSQFAGLDITRSSNKHYTSDNLAQCLRHFYDKVLAKRYGLTIAECELLDNDEITRICLGDTRHIAMISLMISGGSPSICRELANHSDINISDHYCGNFETFLDLLSYERFRPQGTVPFELDVPLPSIDRALPVANGYCQSPLAKQGNFSHCGTAISADGEFGVCEVCKFYLAKGGAVKIKQSASNDLKQTLTLLRQTLRQLQHGYEVAEPLSCVLDRLRAEATRYCHTSAIERLLRERESA